MYPSMSGTVKIVRLLENKYNGHGSGIICVDNSNNVYILTAKHIIDGEWDHLLIENKGSIGKIIMNYADFSWKSSNIMSIPLRSILYDDRIPNNVAIEIGDVCLLTIKRKDIKDLIFEKIRNNVMIPVDLSGGSRFIAPMDKSGHLLYPGMRLIAVGFPFFGSPIPWVRSLNYSGITFYFNEEEHKTPCLVVCDGNVHKGMSGGPVYIIPHQILFTKRGVQLNIGGLKPIFVGILTHVLPLLNEELRIFEGCFALIHHVEFIRKSLELD